jgi:hypothetical protein
MLKGDSMPLCQCHLQLGKGGAVGVDGRAPVAENAESDLGRVDELAGNTSFSLPVSSSVTSLELTGLSTPICL